MTTELQRTALDIQLTWVAYEIHMAREELAEAMGNGRTATREATNAGLSEVAIARTLEVNRRTVRKWLGKDISS